MATPRKRTAPAATQQPSETSEALPSPTPAEVYQAAITSGATPDEAGQLAEARAVEIAQAIGSAVVAGHGGIGWNQAPIEQGDGDTLMVTENGDRFFPDSPADAEHFFRAHGAAPAHSDRWPWHWTSEAQVAFDNADPELKQQIDDFLQPPAFDGEPLDPEHCPTPQQCFPYLQPDAQSATCIHGTTTRQS